MKNYLIYLLAAVSCTTVADLNAQVSTKTGNETTELTIPKKFYKDSIDFSNAPKRLNNKYPLSDQKNEGGWVLNKKASDEFKGKKLNEERCSRTTLNGKEDNLLSLQRRILHLKTAVA